MGQSRWWSCAGRGGRAPWWPCPWSWPWPWWPCPWCAVVGRGRGGRPWRRARGLGRPWSCPRGPWAWPQPTWCPCPWRRACPWPGGRAVARASVVAGVALVAGCRRVPGGRGVPDRAAGRRRAVGVAADGGVREAREDERRLRVRRGRRHGRRRWAGAGGRWVVAFSASTAPSAHGVRSDGCPRRSRTPASSAARPRRPRPGSVARPARSGLAADGRHQQDDGDDGDDDERQQRSLVIGPHGRRPPSGPVTMRPQCPRSGGPCGGFTENDLKELPARHGRPGEPGAEPTGRRVRRCARAALGHAEAARGSRPAVATSSLGRALARPPPGRPAAARRASGGLLLLGLGLARAPGSAPTLSLTTSPVTIDLADVARATGRRTSRGGGPPR